MVFLLVSSFVSCDELDELTEVDFDTTLNENVAVTVPAGEDLVLNETMLINMSNSDTEDYMDVLQSLPQLQLGQVGLLQHVGHANQVHVL